jgi:putative addiction module component (TIGR02574 family)
MLARKLLESVDLERHAETEAAWAAELERRIREIDQGSTELITWDEVRRRIGRCPLRAHSEVTYNETRAPRSAPQPSPHRPSRLVPRYPASLAVDYPHQRRCPLPRAVAPGPVRRRETLGGLFSYDYRRCA